MASPLILCDLTYPEGELSHGGRHRSVQLRELVEDAGFQPAVIPTATPQSNLKSYMRGLQAAISHSIPVGGGWKWLRRFGRTCARFEEAVANHSGIAAVLWENTRPQGWLVPRLARRLGLPVISVPQNLEAMGAGRVIHRTSDYPGKEMLMEATAMRQADRVFCISTEEQWWLGWYGIQASYLPYFPPAELCERMLAIRAERQKRRDNGRLLVLGSASNPPTFQGMETLLRIFQDCGKEAIGVDVVGRETERLPEELLSPGVKIHGRASEQTLRQLMVECRGMVIHQPLAVGALTRVTEVLMAGIPILANPIAARSARSFPGIAVYEDADGLRELMTRDFPMPPVPLKPPEIEAFIGVLQRLADKERTDKRAST
jgi:hypothetical protein